MLLTAPVGALVVLPACQSREEMHAAALTAPASVVEQRARQTRRFETRDEAALLQATVGVLQDLGFTIDESRPAAGLVTGSKARDAREAGQVLLVLLTAAMGVPAAMDHSQRIRILVVVRPAADGRSTAARATFQRVVYASNGASRAETLDDPAIYQAFFDQLAQSSFLTAHDI